MLRYSELSRNMGSWLLLIFLATGCQVVWQLQQNFSSCQYCSRKVSYIFQCQQMEAGCKEQRNNPPSSTLLFLKKNICWYSERNDWFLSYVAGCFWQGNPGNICLQARTFIPVVRRCAYIDQLFPSHTRQGGTRPSFPSKTGARRGGCPGAPMGTTCSLDPFSVHSLPFSYSARFGSSNFSRKSTV